MKILNEQLKSGQLNQLYLLTGEEAYLRKQYRDKLVKALVPEGDTLNYSYYEGKGINPLDVISQADTMPFFAERRVIVVENSGFCKNATPEIADYLKELPETTTLIFVEEEADKRGKIYKAIQKNGYVATFGKQDEKTLARWVYSKMKAEGKKATEQTILFFLSQTGDNMENIERELEKLLCYTLEKDVITSEDVETICSSQTENHIFEMVECVATRQQKKALDYYYDLIALKEPAMRILFLLTRQFRVLMEVKEMDAAGVAPKEIASKIGVPPFVVGKYRAQAKAFKRKELREIVERGVETEEYVKTGRMQDILAVEVFLVECSTPKDRKETR